MHVKEFLFFLEDSLLASTNASLFLINLSLILFFYAYCTCITKENCVYSVLMRVKCDMVGKYTN